MKIAKLEGEKTIAALAKRLVKESSTKTTVKAMTTSLLRLNPHLQQIDRLEAGTPIVIPEAADDPDATPESRGAIATRLAQELETVITALRENLKESTGQASDEIDRAQTWLKGESGKLVLRDLPELKEEFAKTATTANELRKEQAARASVQDKHLRQLQTELATFLAPARTRG